MNHSLGFRCVWRLVLVVLLASQAVSGSGDELTGEQREEAKKAYKKLMLERLFDVKSMTNKLPTDSSNAKLKVPGAIFKKWMELREELREVIPDDRDYFGRINIDANSPHENMWSVPSGDYDVEITMPAINGGFNGDDFRSENARHMAHITLAHDPEEVPAHIEKILPPTQKEMQFTSVHLKYNLSQDIYSSPTAADDFKLAKLYLNREKVNLCNLQLCQKRPIPFFKSGRNDTDNVEMDARDLNSLYQFQFVYILAVNGYDEFNEPITRVHTSRQIDITQTSTLEFDISDIVKAWLQNPKANYGIIVRVSQRSYSSRPKSSTIKRDAHLGTENNSDLEISSREGDVVEHVRLRRAFHNFSDSLDVWLEKQPSLIIWSDPSSRDSPRHHVKRHHKEEDHQADGPDHTSSLDQISTRLPTAADEAPQHTTQVTSDGKLTYPATTSGPHGKREHIPTTTSASSRRGMQSTRNPTNSRPSNQPSGRARGRTRPSGKQMSCSVRSLLISFDEVGWAGWIIAPNSYYANYCSGDCSWPLSDAQNATNHAIIQSIYHSVGRRVPKSCCAPVKLNKMAILYQLDGIVQVKEYDDMIVEACGCL